MKIFSRGVETKRFGENRLDLWAIYESSPLGRVLRHGENIPHSSLPTPCLAAMCFFAVLFSSSLVDSMSGDARLRFSKRMTNPTPFSPFYFYFCCQLICLGIQCFVVDFVRPFHTDSTETSVYERLYLIHCVFSNSACSLHCHVAEL